MQTNNSCHRMLGLAALVTLLHACGDPKSSSTSGPDGGPVPTSRMTIDLTVESSDLRTAVVRANLNDGQRARFLVPAGWRRLFARLRQRRVPQHGRQRFAGFARLHRPLRLPVRRRLRRVVQSPGGPERPGLARYPAACLHHRDASQPPASHRRRNRAGLVDANRRARARGTELRRRLHLRFRAAESFRAAR